MNAVSYMNEDSYNLLLSADVGDVLYQFERKKHLSQYEKAVQILARALDKDYRAGEELRDARKAARGNAVHIIDEAELVIMFHQRKRNEEKATRRLAESIVARYPKASIARIVLARLAIFRKDHGQAEALIKTVLSSHPTALRLNRLLAESLIYQKKFSDAYEAAVNIPSGFIRTFYVFITKYWEPHSAVWLFCTIVASYILVQYLRFYFLLIPAIAIAVASYGVRKNDPLLTVWSGYFVVIPLVFFVLWLI
jgi:hypothetical protein